MAHLPRLDEPEERGDEVSAPVRDDVGEGYEKSQARREEERPQDDEGPGALPGFTGPEIAYYPLPDDEAWALFNQRFIGGEGERDDNLRPWYRCLGVVRGMNARAALVEKYYVCLDHKSEHAAFYSHVDQPRTSYATRVHFFDAEIDPDEVDEDAWRAAYLGYVVCRRGNLPLVARALLRPPSYVQVAAAVSEPVHLLGRTLIASGCPFMQQDIRYANCAHVAAWVICYTAYRLGMIDRKVIADIVDPRGGSQVLRPHSPRGLYREQVEDLLGLFGFRAIEPTPAGAPERIELPNLAAEDLPPVVVARISDLLGADAVQASEDDLSALVANRWIERAEETSNAALVADFDEAIDTAVRRHVERVLRDMGAEALLKEAGPAPETGDDDSARHRGDFEERDKPVSGAAGRPGPAGEPMQLRPADRAVRQQRTSPELAALEEFRSHLYTPYLHSRMPIYLGTRDHAMVLVGSGTRPDLGNRFYVHDDQLGPYLAANDLATLAYSDLEWQTGFEVVGEDEPGSADRETHQGEAVDVDAPVAPRRDMNLHPDFEAHVASGVDLIRRVETVIIPGPARALLPTWAATKQVMGWITVMTDYSNLDGLASELRDHVGTSEVVQSVVMGIDYKSERLRGLDPENRVSQQLFGALNLAEWVVVVEGLNRAGEVVWEAVFDASSSEQAPRLQFFRYLGMAVFESARAPSVVTQATLDRRTLRPIEVAEKVGKVAHGVQQHRRRG